MSQTGVIHYGREADGLHLRLSRPYFCREIPETPTLEVWMYEAPKLERLGTFRDVTLAGGAFLQGDGVNPYHRYDLVG